MATVKRVLYSQPSGNRLYELSEGEYARLEHIIGIVDPRARGVWVKRFLGERVPVTIFPPGIKGPPDDVQIDRALGGNFFTPKWGRPPPEPPASR